MQEELDGATSKPSHNLQIWRKTLPTSTRSVPGASARLVPNVNGETVLVIETFVMESGKERAFFMPLSAGPGLVLDLLQALAATGDPVCMKILEENFHNDGDSRI